MKETMVKIHETWLEMLMAGFMSKTKNKQVLFDFSDILFRHFTWVEHALILSGVSYTYDREAIPIKVDKLSDLLYDTIKRLNEIKVEILKFKDKELAGRVVSDIEYMISVLSSMEDEVVTAFDMQRKLEDMVLTQEATDALTLFLFEETYKEYELILIYNYLQAHSSDATMNRIYQILIDESFFHLKRFGDMGAQMGILAVPRTVMKELYQVTDIIKFLEDGINEELAAKEECKKLSDAVSKDSSELAKFFDFINYQENYHIALMKDALHYYKRENNG